MELSVAAVAAQIPKDVTRGWLVGVVNGGEVIDLRRYRSQRSSSEALEFTLSQYPDSDVVHAEVRALLDWCADQSVKAFA